jgi:hypothetical protein
VNTREAEQVMGRLIAAYPGKTWPESSIAVFASSLLRYEYHSGLRAVTRVTRWSPEFLPGEGLWLSALAEERPEQSALPVPAPEPFTPADEATVRELLGEFWGEGPDAEERRFKALKNSRLTMTPEERAEAAKRYTQSMAEGTKERERDLREARDKFDSFGKTTRRHPQASDCSGKPYRVKQGHRVCDHCSQCVDPDCTPGPGGTCERNGETRRKVSA